MKVKELIELLKTCDQDATVTLDQGPNVTRLSGEFIDMEPEQVFETNDFEYEGKYQDKMIKDGDDDCRKIVVIAWVDCLLNK